MLLNNRGSEGGILLIKSHAGGSNAFDHRQYYRAHSTLDVLALLDAGSESEDSEPGSNSLRKWAGGIEPMSHQRSLAHLSARSATYETASAGERWQAPGI